MTDSQKSHKLILMARIAFIFETELGGGWRDGTISAIQVPGRLRQGNPLSSRLCELDGKFKTNLNCVQKHFLNKTNKMEMNFELMVSVNVMLLQHPVFCRQQHL